MIFIYIGVLYYEAFPIRNIHFANPKLSIIRKTPGIMGVWIIEVYCT